MFEPINRVERLMQAAAADPKQIPGFYAALLEAELFVLTPETEVGPEGRRSLKANEPFNIASVGVQWAPLASGFHRQGAHFDLLDRAGVMSWRESARSLRFTAKIEFLA